MGYLKNPDLHVNPAYQYAVARRILENQGKDAEMLVTDEPQMAMIAEWWKQLFGESEGKEGKGILPCSATSDRPAFVRPVYSGRQENAL